jgi:hypothetical protein
MEIKRDRYLNKLIAKRENGLIKVLTGFVEVEKRSQMHGETTPSMTGALIYCLNLMRNPKVSIWNALTEKSICVICVNATICGRMGIL